MGLPWLALRLRMVVCLRPLIISTLRVQPRIGENLRLLVVMWQMLGRSYGNAVHVGDVLQDDQEPVYANAQT